jgi:hypothetical protein
MDDERDLDRIERLMELAEGLRDRAAVAAEHGQDLLAYALRLQAVHFEMIMEVP